MSSLTPACTSLRPWRQRLRILSACLILGVASIAVGQTLTFPAAPAQWWTDSSLLTSAPTHDSGYATVGQLKNTVWTLAKTLDSRFTGQGGCGNELRAIVRTWDRSFPTTASAAPHTPDIVKDGAMLAVANQGQLKNMALTTYRRLKALGLPIVLKGRNPTTGALISVTVDPDNPATLPWAYNKNSALALVGQIKYCFSFELQYQVGGQVVAWGYDGPSAVPADLDKVVAVSAGVNHNLALRSDGTVVAWGSNSLGQINVPENLNNVTAISAGRHHNLALTRFGTVVIWGGNIAGESYLPSGLSEVVAVAAGDFHSLALKRDGTVVAWGSNATGQTAVPAGLHSVVAIAAGASHSVALKSDGTVMVWGGESLNPPPANLSGVVEIDAGTYYTTALLADGSVVTWGKSFRQFPMLPATTGKIRSFSSGSHYIVAIQQDGSFTGAVPAGYTQGSRLTFPTRHQGLVLGFDSGDTDTLAILAPNPNLIRPVWTSPEQTFKPQGQSLDGIYYRSRTLTPDSTFSAVNLPPGLTIDPVTGIIQGKPLTEGVWTVTLTAQSSLGRSDHIVRFDLSKLAPVIDIQPKDWIAAGWQEILPLTVPYADSVTLSGLPPGLQFDSATRQFSGAATTPGSYPVTVTASNQFGTTSSTQSLHVASLLEWYRTATGPPSIRRFPPNESSEFVLVAAGGYNSAAIRQGGTGIAWGGNSYGQLNFPFDPLRSVDVSSNRSTRLTTDLQIFLKGPNEAYGDFRTTNAITFADADTPVVLLTDGTIVIRGQTKPALKHIQDVSEGMVLFTNGTVAPINGLAPNLASLKEVVQLKGSASLGLALTTQGQVLAWNNATSGFLPTPGSLGNVVALDLDSTTAIALRADGTVLCWDLNSPNNAITLPGLVNVRSVAAGQNRYVASISNTRKPQFHGRDWSFGHDGTGSSGAYYRSRITNGPAEFSATGLPPGLSIDPTTGVVSGSAESPGTWQAQITASNSHGSTQHPVTFYLHELAPQIHTQPTPLLVPGQPFELRLRASQFDTVQVAGLPPGLEFDPATLLISGTPTQAGLFEVSFTFANSKGTSSQVINFPVTSVLSLNNSLTPQPYNAAMPPALISSNMSQTTAFLSSHGILQISSADPYPASLDSMDILSVAMGRWNYGPAHGLALTSDSAVIAWGSNVSKQTVVPTGHSDFVQLAAGQTHSLALKSNGTVIAWGGQTGSSSSPRSPASITPENLDHVVSIAAGNDHNLALRSDGTVFAWGLNTSGQTTVPAGLHDVVAIAAGHNHSLALKADGTVVSWGRDGATQLAVPVGLSSVVAIAAGNSRSMALQSDGTVDEWGVNVSPRSIPIPKASGIAAGEPGFIVLRLPDQAPEFMSLRTAIAFVGQDRHHYRAVESSGTATFSAANLPPGLILDPTTGLITGTPATAGTYTTTLTATNPHGSTDLSVTFHINP